ncbi:hypothetical protein PHYBOEH_002120 [Phytophthora boehmeriae]|uniref:BZIP domain-containing protein n=1 Tax=Phytophthora boehmeriae TaxID=109152 RepID=A0A8T1WST4_9STRA|nr:hypothetical protein PHYBOEH_002120 [Phytophthora boehmeriae]
MNNSVLCAPNSQRFSDVVIGEVRQRSRPAFLFADGSTDSNDESIVPTCLTKCVPGVRADANATPIAAESESQDAYMKVPTESRSVVSRVNRQRKSASKETENETKERLRQRHRETQARYRKRMAEKAIIFERSVEFLREQVQKLEMRYLVMSAGVMPTTPWNIASEYFRLFRSGIPVTLEASKARPHLFQWQVEFLQQTMAPDVAHGTFTGVDSLLEGMKQISLFHSDFDMELQTLECGPSGSIFATFKGTTGIDKKTLRYAFPHLVHNGNGEKWSPLAAKLLGHRMISQGTVQFHWDQESRRMVGLHHKADLLTPFLQLVGNLEDVSRVFERSVMTPDGEFARKESLRGPFSPVV